MLDCGCGGGANIKKLLKKCPQGIVKGIDYSSVSVEKTKKVNETAIAEGRCAVFQGSVEHMNFTDESFDVVTAFETVYFWPGLPKCFQEVYRVLKPGGIFLICNEATGDTDKNDKWTQLIDGMTIYRDVELKAAMQEAGFMNIQIHKNPKDWLCVIGRKQEKESCRMRRDLVGIHNVTASDFGRIRIGRIAGIGLRHRHPQGRCWNGAFL